MFSRGAIGFSTHRDKPLSRLIRWFTGEPWSHTFLITDIIGNRKTNTHRVYLFDAVATGRVAHNVIQNYNNADTQLEIWAPKSGVDGAQDAIEWAIRFTELAFVDKRYSLWSLITSALKLFTRKRAGLPVINPDRGTNCVQVVSTYLAALGPAFITAQKAESFISPGDLHNWVSTSGWFEKIHEKKFDAPLEGI